MTLVAWSESQSQPRILADVTRRSLRSLRREDAARSLPSNVLRAGALARDRDVVRAGKGTLATNAGTAQLAAIILFFRFRRSYRITRGPVLRAKILRQIPEQSRRVFPTASEV